MQRSMKLHFLAIFLFASASPVAAGQTAPPPRKSPSRADLLRGEYNHYRANNDLLFYHLEVRVDPSRKFLSGKNTIRFRMLEDDTRIQLDLQEPLAVDKILFGSTPLKYERDSGMVLVDFPETLRAGRTYSIDFYYSGNPPETGRFGGITFKKDASGHDWVNTACEGQGASIWWPNKDQWRDEVENMEISVAVPSGLVDVSNGRFLGTTDLGDGFTRWDWKVNYPINNYDVSLNIGNYEHFTDHYGNLSLDFYALPEDLEKAKRQFTQVKGMLEAFEHYFGPYPFPKDGYKLIEAPYSGMEHQSAVTYGNHFVNGYLGRDWTGVGISRRFDFIIVHESGHEWFGNSVTAADRSDMWIHEGWTTYLESLYVEYHWGRSDAIKYLNGYKPKVKNRVPIIPRRDIRATPPQDQYFKSALMLNTLRSVVNDDPRWWKLLRDVYDHFKYQTIMTEDLVRYINQQTGLNLTPIFNQYLRHPDIPILDLQFDPARGTVSYRWIVDEPDFQMPVRVGKPGQWHIIHPTTQWQTMKTPLSRDTFQVATDLYFVGVSKRCAGAGGDFPQSACVEASPSWCLFSRSPPEGCTFVKPVPRATGQIDFCGRDCFLRVPVSPTCPGGLASPRIRHSVAAMGLNQEKQLPRLSIVGSFAPPREMAGREVEVGGTCEEVRANGFL